ncbi:hypothetical protein ACG9XR_18995 [Acinetobacter guillouiae]|uniref:hypothetical protein n=1 Tax=Acinetobacter guillouiae TaxID=106649 RepID=UPI003AF481B2
MQNDDEKKVVNLGKLDLKVLKKINSENPKSADDVDYGFSKAKAHEDYQKIAESFRLPNFNEAMKTKGLDIDLNILELSFDQIKKLPDDELLKLLSGEGHNGLIRDATMHLISNEILIRQIKESSKPHLTVYLGLLLAFIAAVTGVIAIIK